MTSYRLLGALEAVDAEKSYALGGTKQRAVLALLLLNATHTVTVARLVDGLWGDDPPKTASHCLRVYVSNLRRTLSRDTADRLATSGSGYALHVDPTDIDARRFEKMFHTGLGRQAAGDPAGASLVLAEAMSLWRGPVLDGLRGQPFAAPYIAHFEELRLSAIEHRISADLELGRHALLVGELEELVAQHPLCEPLWRDLMVALYRSGRPAEALAVYVRLAVLLDAELGVEPGTDLQVLRRDIERHESVVHSFV